MCEKVESKGTTTYNEVADELVAEFADPSSSISSPDQVIHYSTEIMTIIMFSGHLFAYILGLKGKSEM